MRKEEDRAVVLNVVRYVRKEDVGAVVLNVLIEGGTEKISEV